MANLSNEFGPNQISNLLAQVQVPVYQSTRIYQGAMVALLTASGYAVNAGTPATGPVAGVARASCDNSTGSSGDKNINLIEGLFLLPAHATHPPVTADVGKVVYASDNNTISNTASDGIVAGVLVGIDSDSGNPIVFVHAALNRMLATFPPLPTSNGSYLLTITSGVPTWTTHT